MNYWLTIYWDYFRGFCILKSTSVLIYKLSIFQNYSPCKQTAPSIFFTLSILVTSDDHLDPNRLSILVIGSTSLNHQHNLP